eukprot:5112666-Pyramimonas_sp.AAC.1
MHAVQPTPMTTRRNTSPTTSSPPTGAQKPDVGVGRELPAEPLFAPEKSSAPITAICSPVPAIGRSGCSAPPAGSIGPKRTSTYHHTAEHRKNTSSGGFATDHRVVYQGIPRYHCPPDSGATVGVGGTLATIATALATISQQETKPSRVSLAHITTVARRRRASRPIFSRRTNQTQDAR